MKKVIIFCMFFCISTSCLLGQENNETQEDKKEEVVRRNRVTRGDLGTKENAVALIQNEQLYNTCFIEYEPILLLGGKAEVIFDENFIKLAEGKRFFRLSYIYKTKTHTVDLPAECQKVIFSRDQIFEHVDPSDLEKLADKNFVLTNKIIRGFQIFLFDQEAGEVKFQKKLGGFIFSDDETLVALTDSVIQSFKKEVPDLVSKLPLSSSGYNSGNNYNSSSNNYSSGTGDKAVVSQAVQRLFKKKGDKSLQEWVDAIEQVMIEEIGFALVNKYGYNFENNLREWLSLHYE